MATQGTNDFNTQDELGCDLLWDDDMDPTGRLESGVTLVAHDIFWRWNCPPGRLVDDPDYGIDIIQELIAQPLTPAKLATIPRKLEAEARKDQRVQRISVSLSQTDTYAFLITARGLTTSGQEIRLVASVSEGLARIVEVG